jgi:uncharacterized protein (TIGR04255 family)
MLSLERADTVEKLQGALAGWTLTDRQSNVELAVRLGPAGVEQQQSRPESVWVLSSPSEQFRAVVSASSVAVECDRYSHWPDFRNALTEILGAVQNVAAPARCQRLGMRYINELRDPRLESEDPSAMLDVLAEELVAVAVAVDRPVLGSLSELRVREPFGMLAVRHGLIEPGRYLLDLDCYDEQPATFDVGALMSSAERFHARIESFFVWALARDYLAGLAARQVRPASARPPATGQGRRSGTSQRRPRGRR